jgi:hypothetical protein
MRDRRDRIFIPDLVISVKQDCSVDSLVVNPEETDDLCQTLLDTVLEAVLKAVAEAM